MSGSNLDQSGFRMDRSTGKRGGLAGQTGMIAQAYGDATAILGRPWPVPPPNVEFVIPQQDAVGVELAHLVLRLREAVGSAAPSQAAPLGNVVEALVRALREAAPIGSAAVPTDSGATARLRELRAAVEQLADATPVQPALAAMCAFPPIAARF
ncbi:MAG: hypothetical protein HZB53_11600 [Chloroflexi bacterium]|nr:hypothetical protein [Chloroflexota bacterium]